MARLNAWKIIGDELIAFLKDAVFGFDKVGSGWFWTEKYKLKTKIALSGPHRRESAGGTNCTRHSFRVFRIQLWARGREEKLIEEVMGAMLEDLEQELDHAATMRKTINDLLAGDDASTQIADITYFFDDPIPEFPDDEDEGEKFKNKSVVEVRFWTIQAITAKKATP